MAVAIDLRVQTRERETLVEISSGTEVFIGGLVSALRFLKTKKGDRMAVIMLEDLAGTVEAVVFPESFQRCQGLLKADASLFIRGMLDVEDSGARKILVNDIFPMEGLRERMAKSLTIRVNLHSLRKDTVSLLQSLFEKHPGEARIIFELESPREYLITLKPNQFVKVRPGSEFIEEVERICGVGAVHF